MSRQSLRGCVGLRLGACGVVAVLGVLGQATPASADKIERTGTVQGDSRFRKIEYDPHAVITIVAHYGEMTKVDFSDEEEIIGLYTGDSSSWQVVPDGDLAGLTLKPMNYRASTNLIVVSEPAKATRKETFAGGERTRTYTFSLRAHKRGGQAHGTWRVVFTYPREEAERWRARQVEAEAQKARYVGVEGPGIDPGTLNLNYEMAGDVGAFRLSQAFDDGSLTYFGFAPGSPVPAIFEVVGEGRGAQERLVNHRRIGEYIVIEGTAKQFTLRGGQPGKSLRVCVFNMRLWEGRQRRGRSALNRGERLNSGARRAAPAAPRWRVGEDRRREDYGDGDEVGHRNDENHRNDGHGHGAQAPAAPLPEVAGPRDEGEESFQIPDGWEMPEAF